MTCAGTRAKREFSALAQGAGMSLVVGMEPRDGEPTCDELDPGWWIEPWNVVSSVIR